MSFSIYWCPNQNIFQICLCLKSTPFFAPTFLLSKKINKWVFPCYTVKKQYFTIKSCNDFLFRFIEKSAIANIFIYQIEQSYISVYWSKFLYYIIYTDISHLNQTAADETQKWPSLINYTIAISIHKIL